MIPEKNKQAGVCYAFTDDGVELPVIDVTHPAFALDLPAAADLAARIAKEVRDNERAQRLPAFLRRALAKLLARDSVMLAGMFGADAGFLGGMTTYLMKLGAANLGQGWRRKRDAEVAGSVACLALRMRLRDLVGYLATGLVDPLASDPRRPLCFVNVAGGPCIDSLNTLLVLAKEHRALLAGREIRIHVFDLVAEGPAFGQRALAALQAPGAPLAGLDIGFAYHSHRWEESDRLRAALERLAVRDCVTAVTSEGGFGDYADDTVLQANLEVLAGQTGADALAALTFSPNEGTAAAFNRTAGIRIVYRSPEEFTGLVERSGWSVAETKRQPIGAVAGLRKAR